MKRFARYYRTSLFNMLRRTADIAVSGVQMLKFQSLSTAFRPHQSGIWCRFRAAR